jgi:integrase/recombinase XerD
LEAGKFWVDYKGPYREKQRIGGSSRTFVKIAKAWLSFHGKLANAPEPCFQRFIAAFSEAMRTDRGLSEATTSAYSRRVRCLLKWFAERNDDFGAVSLLDVDAFMERKRADGLSPRSVANQCQALRTFFGFAETQGWCVSGIPLGIRSPRIPTYEDRPKGPNWLEVEELLRSADGPGALERRAKAILFLSAVYGLRCSEVAGLRLDDFDWRSEIVTVRRAKRGGTHHYPIQYEVGEAILAYLKQGRPQCSSRSLFVNMRRPYGPISQSSIWRAVGLRIRRLGVQLDHVGSHSLRHACATRLLHKGTSLSDIAEFLGHRDAGCIGIYARYDIHSLRKVAAFRLTGL